VGALDPASLITAVSGLGAVGTGYVLSRRSTDEQRKQQAVANHIADQELELEREKVAFARLQDINDRQAKEIEDQRREIDRQRSRAADEERRRDEDRAHFEKALRRAHDDLATLRAVVLSEAASAAAEDGLERIDEFLPGGETL
jgi:hypothetical protein